MRYYYGIIFKGERIMKIKKWFDAQNFMEVETPILIGSTPEGARGLSMWISYNMEPFVVTSFLGFSKWPVPT